jgi:hypothetical protein
VTGRGRTREGVRMGRALTPCTVRKKRFRSIGAIFAFVVRIKGLWKESPAGQSTFNGWNKDDVWRSGAYLEGYWLAHAKHWRIHIMMTLDMPQQEIRAWTDASS